MGRLSVVGMGPGDRATMTQAAYEALQAADVICGYTTYVKLASAICPHARTYATGMGGEVERCKWALEEAVHKDVALVCGGDAGVYGLAGLVHELGAGRDDVEVEVIPGVTAALAGAAVLGAPLVNDYCSISLSDHLTPWDTIAHRLHAAAEAGIAICLYNPSSRQRPDHLRKACDILLQSLDAHTVCGWVRNIGRPEQEHGLLTLQALRNQTVDMFTTVFVGAPQTVVTHGRMVTPRGYNVARTGEAMPSAPSAAEPTAPTPRVQAASQRILLFGGTTEGRVLTRRLHEYGHDLCVSVATQMGAEELKRECSVEVRVGRLDASAMAELLEGYDLCVDATHPYAQKASEQIREACTKANVPLRRVMRASSDLSGCTVVTSASEAAHALATTKGAILMTIGTKELAHFADIDPARLYVRILATHESLDACERLGIPHRNIIAMQGPFSPELNEALMRQHHIRWLVTKDGGRAGGLHEKLKAAQHCGVHSILVARPDDTGTSMEDLLASLCPVADKESSPLTLGDVPLDGESSPMTFGNAALDKGGSPLSPDAGRRMRVALVGMGCAGENLTSQASRALASAELIVGAKRLVEALPKVTAHVEVAARAQDVAQMLRTSKVRHAAVVLSGDVGFFSAATRLTQLLANDGYDVESIPGISSMQLLAARLGRCWQDWTLCSAHGRDCDVVGKLRDGHPVFLLTSSAQTVRTLCNELDQVGLGSCMVTVGERLGYDDELLRTAEARHMAANTFDDLNVMLIEQPAHLCARKRAPGLPDKTFVRANVPMTKQELRACILAKLAVTPEDLCWDVGAGTGAVSIELALASKETWAIEHNPRALNLIRENRKQLCAWNLHIVEGTAPESLLGLPRPDVVFVGGSSGNLKGILHAAIAANSEVRLCVSAISLETLSTAVAWMDEQGLSPEVTQVSISRTREVGNLHLLAANNPVFLIVGHQGSSAENNSGGSV